MCLCLEVLWDEPLAMTRMDFQDVELSGGGGEEALLLNSLVGAPEYAITEPKPAAGLKQED